MRVWNLASGGLERTLKGHTEGVLAVAVTPDGQRIVSAGDHTVRVWDLDLGSGDIELTHWVSDRGITCVVHTNHPRTLVYSDDGGGVHVLSLHPPTGSDI